MYDITTTLCMTSYTVYITSHPLFMISHLYSHHITSTGFMTPHTLYMTSHTWQHKLYICPLTHYIWHYIHCICVIKTSVSVIPHPLSGWHHTHSMYDIIFSRHDITWTLYDIKHLYVWHHNQYIYDIICSVYDITHTAFMTTLCLYLTSHPLYLTTQPLYLCHHTDDTHICIAESRTSQQVWTSSHLANLWDHTHSTWHHIHTL